MYVVSHVGGSFLISQLYQPCKDSYFNAFSIQVLHLWDATVGMKTLSQQEVTGLWPGLETTLTSFLNFLKISSWLRVADLGSLISVQMPFCLGKDLLAGEGCHLEANRG